MTIMNSILIGGLLLASEIGLANDDFSKNVVKSTPRTIVNTHFHYDHTDTIFYTVQVVELVAGMAQLSLLGLNFRDGLKMTGRLRTQPKFAG